MVSDVQDRARVVMGDTGGACVAGRLRVRPGQNRTRMRDAAWNDYSVDGLGFQ